MIKVIERKLGREKADGLTDQVKLIEIDPRITPYNRLQTLIHEHLHILFPDWSETKIKITARKQARFLWNNNYREVKQ